MKILYTMTSYPPATGGAQQHIHEIARRLTPQNEVRVIRQWNKNRHDWLLGSTLNAPDTTSEIIEGVKTEGLSFSLLDRLQMSPFIPFYYGAPQILSPPIAQIFFNRLKEIPFKPDVIHHGRIGRENLALASLMLARHYKVPFMMTPFHHPRWTGWRYKLYLDLYKKADHLFALTEGEKSVLEKLGVASNAITVIGHGPSVLEKADGKRFRKKHDLKDAPIVLFLGQKYLYKGFNQLLQAAPQVWEKKPETRFVFIGPRTSESEKIFKKVSDQRILELGAVSLEEKCDALDACTVFTLPSSQESFGGVYVEAWMYKKPVVGGNISAIADVIDDGVNGVLVNQDPKDIAQGILSFLSDPSRAALFGERGHKKALDKYSWPTIANKVASTYQSLLTRF